MKSIRFNLIAAAVCSVLISISTGCSVDEPDNLWADNEEQETPDTPSGDDICSEAEINRLLKQHVKVSASYGDYVWKFHIESTLHTALPDEDVQFGIGHGIKDDGTETIYVEDDVYSYKWHMSGNKKFMDIVNPYWDYYIYTVLNPDYKLWSLCDLFYKSYVLLKDRPSLTDEEKDLMKATTHDLNKYEIETRYSYHPAVYVKINYRFYKIAAFSRK